jgi:hypothetical protein
MVVAEISRPDGAGNWHWIRIVELRRGEIPRKEVKMRKFVYAFAAGALAAAMAVPVFAQTNPNADDSQPTQMAAAKSGNAIIEAGGASDADLNVARYKAWDEFQSSHPEVARELKHNPRLTRSPEFLNKHPELKQLFESNAGMQEDMIHNPGNYMARMSWAGHHHHHHHGSTG